MEKEKEDIFSQGELLPLLARLRESLAPRCAESYLAGGCLRDALLGRTITDLDIAVRGDALLLARKVAAELGGSYVPLDEAKGIARVVLPKGGSGERLNLDFSTLRGGIREDLALRDFTINAMAVSLAEVGEVIDPFGGRCDLKRGVVHALGDDVFRADPARMVRAVRFAAELGFSIESDTEALIRRDASLINRVAAERVREELYRILAVSQADRFLRYLDDLGLLKALIPELEGAKGVGQPKEHFWDVFDHSMETVAALERLLGLPREKDEKIVGALPRSTALAAHFQEEMGSGHTRGTLLKLAGLLHDIAKPQSKSVEEGGRIRFFGHAKVGAGMAAAILTRLRFSGREVKMVERVIEHHLRPGQMSSGGELPTRRAIYRYFRDTGEEGIDTLFLNLADHLAARGPNLDLEAWREHARAMQHVLTQFLEEKKAAAPPRLLSGHDLMERFGMSPGPRIGELLEAVREAQAVGEVSTREEALAFVERHLLERAKTPIGRGD